MCLIITGPAGKVRNTLLQTPTLLADIVDSNKDGIGSMYASDDGVVVVAKMVPKDLAEARAFIEQLPEADRDLALHFRMRTHGDVDLTNCHPYPVLDGQLHLMHNGVIHHVDDKSDLTKSDTWHYIEQTLKPQLQLAPGLIEVPAWQGLIAENIGASNRIVFLDKDGRLVIVNKKTGLEHDGMWFSNRYAWTPGILIPSEARTYYGRGSYVWNDDEEWTGWDAWQRSRGQSTTTTTPITALAINRDDVWTAIKDADADALYKLLDSYPVSTLMALFEHDQFVCSVETKDLSQQDGKVVSMLENGEQQRLVQYCNKSHGRCRKVAEVAAWYGDWVGKVEPTKSEPPAAAIIEEGSNADEADLATWRHDFHKWMEEQGLHAAADSFAERHEVGGQSLTGTATSPYPTAAKQPAKWTALTSPTATLPAVVASIGARKIRYRGYAIEVPADLFAKDKWVELRDHLENEAQRLHAEHTHRLAEARAREEQGEHPLRGEEDTSNETYAA
jgi:hypothetical protein